jgi:hypothetical protein
MGKLRKIGKKVGSAFKKVGKKLKSGFKKIAAKFGELGPLGTIALSFVIPTVGAWFQGLPNDSFLKVVADGIGQAAGAVKDGVGKVFNTVMDGVENGMNKIAGKAINERGFGSSFRDGVSKLTGDFIEGSTKELSVDGKLISDMTSKEFEIAKKAGKIDLSQAQDRFTRKNLKGTMPTDASDFAEKIIERPDGKKVKERWYHRDTFMKQQGKAERSLFGDMSPAQPDSVTPADNFRDYIKTSKEFGVAKRIMPVQAATSTYFRNEEAQEAAMRYAKNVQREYFSDMAQNTLIRPINPNVSYLDFSAPMNSEELFRLQNAYTGILGESFYG